MHQCCKLRELWSLQINTWFLKRIAKFLIYRNRTTGSGSRTEQSCRENSAKVRMTLRVGSELLAQIGSSGQIRVVLHPAIVGLLSSVVISFDVQIFPDQTQTSSVYFYERVRGNILALLRFESENCSDEGAES
uniref:Uncharacterized protein n=1 Tax=Nothobranchius kadleci TaxID=1051664 RepID=A0A1A8E9U9_NOTKA